MLRTSFLAFVAFLCCATANAQLAALHAGRGAPGGGTVTPAFVRSSGNSTGFVSSTQYTQTITAPTSGDTILCAYLGGTAAANLTGITATDNQSNTWTVGTILDQGTQSTGAYIYLNHILNAPTTITVTVSGAALLGNQMGCDEFSGTAATSPFDTSAQATGATAFPSPNTGPMTTTANGDLIWNGNIQAGGTCTATTNAPGSGFTAATTAAANCYWSQYQVQVTAGSITPTMTNSGVATTFMSYGVAMKHGP